MKRAEMLKKNCPSILAPREVLRPHFECYIAVCAFAKCLVSKPFSPSVSQPQVFSEPFDVRLLTRDRGPSGGPRSAVLRARSLRCMAARP